MKNIQNRKEGPESYPKPTETDQQLKSQEEFVEQPVTGNNLNSPNPDDPQREREKEHGTE